MAQFNPKDHNKREPNQNDGVPAGDYLLVLKSFTRKTSQKGNPYLRALYKVIHGPAKDRTFFDSLSIDMDNKGAMFRLSMFAEQAGATAFDLDSDRDIREQLCNRPFKARVNREISGQWINNGVARYLGNEVTEFERRFMDTWAADFQENQQINGGGGGGDGIDDSGMPEDGQPIGDDDLPF